VTVIDKNNPAHSTDVTLPGTNANYSLQYAPEGGIYMLTTTPAGTSGVSSTYLTRIDPNNPAQSRSVTVGDVKNASISSYYYSYDGYSYVYSNTAFAPDGTVWVDVTTPTGQPSVVAVNPNFTGASAPVALASGTVYQRTVGADGTLYEIRYTYDSASGTYTSQTVTVIDPDDPTHASTIAVPGNGYPQGYVQVSPAGTAYLHLGYQYTQATGYTTRVMVFDPSDPYHPTTMEFPGYSYSNNLVVNDDGSAFIEVNGSGTTKLIRINTASSVQSTQM
jgi:hypothetical protein